MNKQEARDAYEKKMPVFFRDMYGRKYWYDFIYGYQIERDSDGEEKFFVMLLDRKESKSQGGSIIICPPEKIFLAERI